MIDRNELSWGTRKELERCEELMEACLRHIDRVRLPALQERLLDNAIACEQRIDTILARKYKRIA